MRLKCLSYMMRCIMLGLFLTLCAATLYLGAFQDKEHLCALSMAALTCMIFYFLCRQ